METLILFISITILICIVSPIYFLFGYLVLLYFDDAFGKFGLNDDFYSIENFDITAILFWPIVLLVLCLVYIKRKIKFIPKIFILICKVMYRMGYILWKA